MCGISGIYAFHYASLPVDQTEIDAMNRYQESRGPDGVGSWIEEGSKVGFGHRRLAIIDPTPEGAQPMHSACGRFCVTFNGEIYNYRSLRNELKKRGRSFRSESDTEVLLAAYAEYGMDMFRHLRGMYAFAIWDRETRELVLARDPYGVKPLYYADDGWTCRFASQVKALRATGHIDDEPEPAGHLGFLLLGSVPEPFTLYQQIRAVPAGAYVRVDELGPKSPVSHTSVASLLTRRPECGFARTVLEDSVQAHLVADVPVGAFLSAGVDSTLIATLAAKCVDLPLRTITVGFAEFQESPDDEVPLATAIARSLGCEHTNRTVTRREFDTDLADILFAMDQPSIDGINTWFASKAAAEQGLKVVLSGLGGDELLGSYPSFNRVPAYVRRLAITRLLPGFGAVVRKILEPLLGRRGISPKASSLFELGGTWEGAYQLVRGLFMPSEFARMGHAGLLTDGEWRLDLPTRIRESGFRQSSDAKTRVSILESYLYMKNQLLRDTDWASMAHSVEIRVPLVDSRLAQDLPQSTCKPSLLDEFPEVSRFLSGRPKSGFGVPLTQWLNCGPQHWSRAWAQIVNTQFGPREVY